MPIMQARGGKLFERKDPLVLMDNGPWSSRLHVSSNLKLNNR